MGLADVVGSLTLEEKATLLTGASAWTTAPVPRVGLGSLTMADGPHGVRRTHDTGSMALDAHPATCFPTASCTAATWDPELLREMGRAIAAEAIALGVDVVLGPGANIKRSPLCGRNFEYFSEDPLLSGRLAAAWIEGIQSEGVGASLKHFAVNNQETRRMSVSAEVDERTLREIYLPAFEHAVTRARPWTVMCAYNRINGTYASEHRRLLTDVLRKEWGFDGVVVSDWAAVHDRPAALAAGLDLEMPGPRPRRVRAVVDAVSSGELDAATVDAAAARVVRMVTKARTGAKGKVFDADAHHRLARRIAADGMVLLKNEGVLPLAGQGTIAVIGEPARHPRIQGGGSSQIVPTRLESPFEELARLAPAARITFAPGYDDEYPDRQDLTAEAARIAATADVAIVFVGLSAARESEGRDRTDLDLAPQQVAAIAAVAEAQPRTVVVLSNGSAVVMAPWVDQAAAVLEAWYAGQAAGGAVAEILLGIAEPGGRLPETFPVRLEDTPAYLDFPGDGDTVRYGEGMFVGYRWYDTRRLPVSFPFGHGLSYTTFAHCDVRVTQAKVGAGEGTSVSVDVTNTGQRSGSDVVQVYVRARGSSVARPDKELRGFAKVRLGPGQTTTVTIDLDARAFAFWDVRAGRWIAEPGTYDILVARSSADIVASIPVTVAQGTRERPLTDMSPLKDWLDDDVAGSAARAMMHRVGPILGSTFGTEGDARDRDPHFDSYFGAMPVRGLLEFAAGGGGPDPDAELGALMAAGSTGARTADYS